MRYCTSLLAIAVLSIPAVLLGNINSATVPLLIDSPGLYQVSEDVMYSATSDTPAIIVATNDVSIDFREFTISQADGFGYSVTGIQIAPSISGVTIKHGMLKNFTQSAVSVAQGASFVVMNDMVFNGMGNRIIECIGTVATPAFQIEILNSTFLNSCTLTTADNMITFSNCTDFEMLDCLFSTNGNFSATGTIVGVKITNASRYLLNNVGIGNSKGNADFRGFSLKNSSGGIFEGCRAANAQAAGATSTCRGFQLEAGTNSSANFFNNCIAFGLTGNTVDGFLSDTGCNGNMYTGCLAGVMTAVGATGVSHGFRCINNSKTTYKNCEARGCAAATSTVSPYGAYGFKLDTATSVAMLSCLSYFHAAPAGSSVGIYAIEATSCLFRENQSSSNKQGFDLQGTFTKNTFVRNIAERNSNTAQYKGFPTTAVSDNIWSSSVEIVNGPWTNIGIS
jgi:parallel beta-helix repeat protein